ncbi:CBS domain-containing protein [Ferrovibrio xuzhouensis]|uniref:CBS domain-containing protein n=1 Tax=Ferrovibrio xuzhouensis TaxID=1576914 RepID=A0ABV7VMC9_9PROT
MRVSEVMTRDVRLISPDHSIQEAAGIMADIDAGALPVGQDDRLVGIITDRDIAIRGVGRGCDAATKIGEVMSADIKYCFDDEDIGHVVKNMGDIQVRRLPVMNRSKRLVGILSLGDIATEGNQKQAAEVIRKVSEPNGQHRQSMAGMR